MVFSLVIPMVIQQGITSFVNLVDNVMVGKLGTEAFSGVSIVNQIMFVFYLSIFGAISGASILGAQYYGKGDEEGVRYTFRFKFIISVVLLALALVIFIGFGPKLISLFLTEGEQKVGDIALTFKLSKSYLKIMLIGLFPFIISQAYSSTLRDTGETVIPMVGSIIAVVTNFFLNLILIFGLLGAPKLGVVGAAIATVIARFAEMIYMLICVTRQKIRFHFLYHGLRSLHIPKGIAMQILKTGWPLLVNEFLWSMGQTTLTRNYSLRGLEVVGAFGISNTVSNLFFIVCLAMGNVISILVGQQLGAGEIEKAKDTDRKLLFFNVVLHIFIAGLLAIGARYIPRVFDTDDIVKKLATQLLYVYALALPLNAFNHGTYFTIRSGGKTIITFIFDSVCTWVISIPLAYLLVNHTGIGIVSIYFIICYADFFKAIIGYFMVKSGYWAKRIVHDDESNVEVETNHRIHLEGERILIESKTISEMEILCEQTQDNELKQAYTEMLNLMKQIVGHEEWACDWTIKNKEGDSVIGGIGFKGMPDDNGIVEVGYGINESYRNQGYATEAVKVMLEWALQQAGVKRIQAQTEEHNEISKRVLLKNGFQHIGVGYEGPLYEVTK